MIANTLSTDVMLQLGQFQFGISSAAYQELNRTTEHTWASQARFGQLDALQYTGPGQDSITLPGVIFPEFRGGLLQLDMLRAIAATGEPQLMMDGAGSVLGLWIIERVEERQKLFAAAGMPRKQEFTLQLRKFGDAAAELVSAISAASSVGAAAAAAGDLKTAAGAVSAVTGLAGQLKGLANGAISSLTGALSSVQGIAGQLAGQAKGAIGAITRGLDAAKGLRNLATSTLSQLKALPTMLAARAGAGNLATFAVGMLTQTTSAQKVMGGIIGNLGSSITTPAQNILASAQSSLGTLTSTARLAGASATNMLKLMA